MIMILQDTKRLITFLFSVFSVLLLSAQTQHGYVKTKGDVWMLMVMLSPVFVFLPPQKKSPQYMIENLIKSSLYCKR